VSFFFGNSRPKVNGGNGCRLENVEKTPKNSEFTKNISVLYGIFYTKIKHNFQDFFKPSYNSLKVCFIYEFPFKLYFQAYKKRQSF